MKANTDEMKRIASDINSIATEYQSLITSLYNKFANLSQTKEWVGGKAQQYVSFVMLDKPDMMSVGDKLKKISKTITEDANILDNNSSKTRSDESHE